VTNENYADLVFIIIIIIITEIRNTVKSVGVDHNARCSSTKINRRAVTWTCNAARPQKSVCTRRTHQTCAITRRNMWLERNLQERIMYCAGRLLYLPVLLHCAL